jgi:hypothetical protein
MDPGMRDLKRRRQQLAFLALLFVLLYLLAG